MVASLVAAIAAGWRGRARFVVFDSAYSAERFTALVDAWAADPQRPARLHVVALAAGTIPGVQRIPQVDACVTLDLVCESLDVALARLETTFDFIHLHGASPAPPPDTDIDAESGALACCRAGRRHHTRYAAHSPGRCLRHARPGV